ncbi:MAG: hypothetical protein KAT16_05405 [Candidatus Heimdallarchaeota archaeon]|nr:hypothetical protein [Candidatus Heimdallarchaeota archaeon]
MTNPKGQLQLYYAQQKTLIEQIKIIREDLQKEHKLTTQYRKKRDRYKSERQVLLEKAVPDTEGRESQKETIEKLRKRKDFLRRQSQRSTGTSFKILSNDQLERLTLVELKFILYELEFKQQTSSLKREDEDVIVEEIRRVEERIVLLEKRNEVIVADYLGNVPDSKEKMAEEISSIERRLSLEEDLRNKMHSKVQGLYDRIGPLKEEEDKAHQEFVDHLQKLEELKVDVQAKQEELDALKGKIAQVKKKISQESHKEKFDKIEGKIQLLIKKREKGDALTPEEQEYLMSYGYVPF